MKQHLSVLIGVGCAVVILQVNYIDIVFSLFYTLLPRPGMGSEYCDQRINVSVVSVSVCISLVVSTSYYQLSQMDRATLCVR